MLKSLFLRQIRVASILTNVDPEKVTPNYKDSIINVLSQLAQHILGQIHILHGIADSILTKNINIHLEIKQYIQSHLLRQIQIMIQFFKLLN